SSTFAKRVDAEPGGTLELDLETGGTVEVRGWDESSVVVRAKLAGRDWSSTRVAIEPSADGVRVHSFPDGAGHSYATSHEFSIQVPQGYELRLRSAGGGVSIVGVQGTFRGLTGGGGVELHEDRGRVFLTTGGGEIDVTDCELDGRVSTGGGGVNIERTK